MNANPFLLSPNTDLFFRTDSVQATLAKIDYVVSNRQGLTVVYGDVGLGKTTLMQYLFERYASAEETSAAYIPTPRFKTDTAFLREICDEFGLRRRRSMADQENELRAHLVAEFAAGRNTILLVDEAQLVPGRVLELVRLLLNIDTRHGKLLQIVLCGQLELRDRLRDESKRALRSRIFITSTLDPLTLDEARQMIAHRCRAAGCVVPFDDATVETIWRRSRGVPREIVKRSAAAFTAARAMAVDPSPELVDAVSVDMEPV